MDIVTFAERITALPWAVEVFSVALGLVLSWQLTQFLKRRTGAHGWTARLWAAVIGFSATVSVAIACDVSPVLAFWLAVAVAIGSPSAYKILVEWKGDDWPWVHHLSGDPWTDEHEDLGQ